MLLAKISVGIESASDTHMRLTRIMGLSISMVKNVLLVSQVAHPKWTGMATFGCCFLTEYQT